MVKRQQKRGLEVAPDYKESEHKKNRDRKLRIAILGTRGIPANYGGFETFAEELSIRLVERGHFVTVYCRPNNIQYNDKEYHGVKLVILPSISHKYFDTVFHTFLSMLHIFLLKYDLILMCNAANSPFCLLPRLFGKKVLLNVDGEEKKRKKWNVYGRMYYRLCENLAVWFPSAIISDSLTIQQYYWKKFHIQSIYIAYGSRTLNLAKQGTEILERFGLEPGRYLLYVSRLEPENNAHEVIAAFEQVKTDMKLAIVGTAPYSDGYIDSLHRTQDERIVFTGGVYGDGYFQLQTYPYLYIQATEVGGTHPALLEGMGAGNCIVYKDVPEHREVVRDAGFPYMPVEHLREQLQFLIDHADEVAKHGTKARKIVEEHYTWEKIYDQYEELFYSMLSHYDAKKKHY